MSTTEAQQRDLTHAPNCSSERQLDVVSYAEQGITTTHCVDCGAHEARTNDGQIITAPATGGPFNAASKPGLLDGITIESAEAQA